MNIWDIVFVNPLINSLIILNNVLFSNFGLAIIVFTLLMRLATMPLTLRQIHSTRAMTTLQPKMQEIQKKHKDPKRRQEETMKLYRQAGVNPLGCLLAHGGADAHLVRPLWSPEDHGGRHSRECGRPLPTPLPLGLYRIGGAPGEPLSLDGPGPARRAATSWRSLSLSPPTFSRS